MEHTTTAPHNEHSGGSTKEIWKVTGILTVLTLIELALGYWMIGMGDGFMKHFVKGVIIILMLAKAFYIVGYFMHLKHEIRNMIMTIIVPLLLFVWFIIAFLADGNSYRNLRNEYSPYYKERATIKIEEKKESEEHGAQPEKQEEKPGAMK